MNHAQKRRPSLRQLGTSLLAAALGLLCALVVAACGSSSSASGTTSTTTTSSTTTTGTSTTSASFAAFRNCLTQHGAPAPPQGGGFGGGRSGGGGQPGAGGTRPTPSPAVQKALTACASLRPAGGFGGGGRPGGGAGNSTNPAFAKFQACIKSHGGTTGSNSAAAIAACRSLLPNGGNGDPAGSATITPTTTTG